MEGKSVRGGRAAAVVLASVLALAATVAIAAIGPRIVELKQSEGSEARTLGLPSRIDPDRATGVAFADRQALGSWLKQTKGLRAAEAASEGKHAQSLPAQAGKDSPQRAAAMRQLHALSTAKRAAMKASVAARTQQLTNTGVPALPVPGTVTIPAPTGFTIRTGKKISGILDVAAPLDPDSGAAVPGIVVPNGAPGGTMKYAQSRKIKAYTDAGIGKSDMQPALATKSAVLAAQDGAQSMLAQQPQSQQSQALAQMPEMADDEDMYPDTDAQQYDYINSQPVEYPVPQQGESQVYTATGGALVTQSVTSPMVQNPQSWEVTGSYPPASYHYSAQPLMQPQAAPVAPVAPSAPGAQADTTMVRPIPNYFNAPFKRWADEDSAQHAYNLQAWRLKILQAKEKQAQLRKQILALSDSQPKVTVRVARKQGGENQGRWRALEQVRSDTSSELKTIEAQVLALARLEKASLKRRRTHRSWRRDEDRHRDDDHGGRRDRDRRGRREHRRDRGRRGRRGAEGGRGSGGSRVAQELHEIWKAVTGLKEKVASSHDAALDVLAAPPVAGGVAAQAALWKKVTADVSHSH